MKHKYSAQFIWTIFACLIIVVCSCRKINDATEVGGGLIPPIDNITTFEQYLPVETDNFLMTDSSQLLYVDDIAVGHINDPEFGTTHADGYFNFSYVGYGLYPFVNRDSVIVDSVVLQLAYKGIYGDSTLPQTLRVFEIDRNSVPAFDDTTLYKLTQSPAFATAGPELGSRTFIPANLKDSITIIRGDTTKVANVIRIKLDTLRMGRRFVNFDTAFSPTGGFRSDSIFKSLFRGLAIKADASGNALAYIGPSNSNTQLTIYFRYTKNGVADTTASLSFIHATNGQADLVTRVPGGNWLTYLNNGVPQDDKLYIQSTPGSFGRIRIPGLDTFRNVTIHRAELVFNRIPSQSDDKFVGPAYLFLDAVNNAADTVFSLDQDMSIQYDPSSASFSYNLDTYGGTLRASDTTYRFNISRYVQGIVTRKEPNRLLRVSAPLRTVLFSKSANTKVPLYITGPPAYGRAVLGGGNYADPALRARFRIVFSKI